MPLNDGLQTRACTQIVSPPASPAMDDNTVKTTSRREDVVGEVRDGDGDRKRGERCW